MARFWKVASLSIIAMVFFLALTLIVWASYLYSLRPMIPKMASPRIIQLQKYASASAFAKLLQENGFIHSKIPLLFMLRLQDLTDELKAGIYQVQPGETPSKFVQRVVNADVLQGRFQIIEGTTQHDVVEDLEKAPFLAYQQSDWHTVIGKYKSAEGLLLANTYHYDAGSLGKHLLDRAHRALVAYLDIVWVQRASNLPYKTPYDLLIAASILEKETALPHEKRVIAGVIVNRLKKNMPLQMDPTVVYALGEHYQGRLSRKDLRIDSPYNTYLNRGLPPTPIAMVGKEAIYAAAHPEETEYFYFVAKGDGSHHFSKTYDEQRRAIAQYLTTPNWDLKGSTDE